MDSIPQPTTPAYIGHYHLLEPIGRGGMGLVFRARDTRLEREVAIKCLRTELFEAHYIERFKREALLLAKLNHPNIVQIYDFIEAPDQLALVMELVDGQNLQTYLREHIVPMSQRLHWLTQIAEGLAIAHDAGIIHRDLKAENILINKRGQSKITDLGIAKSQDFNATLTDHVAGSYCSMSPEQAMGEDISFKSDLFSLGILAYQLLCGAHPFGDTGNKLQIMQRIISHPPTPPHQHNPDLPAEFVDLLGQLLSKDPNKRPDNTHWVAAQFKKLSAINVHDNIASDDTQALAMPQYNIARSARTQDHPTFETRFVAVAAPKISLWKKLKDYIAANKIVVGSAALSVLMITGVIVWQLQPKPPKYVAVIPPKLTAEGMQESQQELVKGAVYDAIQQSVIQLDGYYLIPQEEIANVNGSNEDIRKATVADELITSDIKCRIETCAITLTRLEPETQKESSRLRVRDARNIDVLADRYISVMETAQNTVGTLYSTKIISQPSIPEHAYKAFLESTQQYRNSGASLELLKKIDGLPSAIKETPTTSTLYKDISLDLFYDTNNEEYLDRLETYNKQHSTRTNTTALHNQFYLDIARGDFNSAKNTIKKIEEKDGNKLALNDLHAYMEMVKNNYEMAIYFYKNSLKVKKTANSLYNIANAYRYQGNSDQALKYATEALSLSPKLYQANSLLGVIALMNGEIEKAITSFESAVAQNPQDISNINNLGLCNLLKKNYSAATKNFTDALSLSPNNTTFLLNLADSENLKGNNEKSKQIYASIISTSEGAQKNRDHLRNLAQAYAHTNNFSKSFSTLQELERLDSQNIETTYTAALVHALAKNTKSSIFNVENSLKNGMNGVWFRFPWFDSLCTDTQFKKLLAQYGEPNRCPHKL
ncbi:serine/threonine protein kinase [Cellvibrio mixtus]|uniref:Serine/threonine protein kinase n=1 Tax=Cellvibrio mixtus TaxID=39650 RepID=A0A266QB88_9GAMM|nr:serine/threonine-protein kinase [Cellvibrio mixtus]OZY87122.1 serine/threonine protein kinase [Cellvibrio mixtus]